MDFELVAEVVRMMERTVPIAGASATVGFDGFTDTIVRVVRGLAPDRSPVHFRSKRDFGEEIVGLGPDNSSFDLTTVATKMGGNGPITAHALGRLGLSVNCIGMMGRPDIHGLFGAMDRNCTLHSFAEPTHTTALEFEDGKLLLAGADILKTADWPVGARCDRACNADRPLPQERHHRLCQLGRTRARRRYLGRHGARGAVGNSILTRAASSCSISPTPRAATATSTGWQASSAASHRRRTRRCSASTATKPRRLPASSRSRHRAASMKWARRSSQRLSVGTLIIRDPREATGLVAGRDRE